MKAAKVVLQAAGLQAAGLQSATVALQTAGWPFWDSKFARPLARQRLQRTKPKILKRKKAQKGPKCCELQNGMLQRADPPHPHPLPHPPTPPPGGMRRARELLPTRPPDSCSLRLRYRHTVKPRTRRPRGRRILHRMWPRDPLHRVRFDTSRPEENPQGFYMSDSSS